MTHNRPEIYASVLGVRDSLREAALRLASAGIDGFHLDLTDGRYAPRSARRLADLTVLRAVGLPVEVHVMAVDAHAYVAELARLGAERVYVHPGALHDADRVQARVTMHGVHLALALSDVDAIPRALDWRPAAALALLVSPGQSGASMRPDAGEFIETLHQITGVVPLTADGGIRIDTADAVIGAGVRRLVVGSALTESSEPEAVVAVLRAKTCLPWA